MTKKKYELTENAKTIRGHTLYQIRAVEDFVTWNGIEVSTGDLGGFIKSEYNLSQRGRCWVMDDAKVYGEARVCDDAVIAGNSSISGYALVLDCGSVKNSYVYDKAVVDGKSRILDGSKVHGHSRVSGETVIRMSSETYGNAIIKDKAQVLAGIIGENAILSEMAYVEHAEVYGNAIMKGKAMAIDGAVVKGTTILNFEDCVSGR